MTPQKPLNHTKEPTRFVLPFHAEAGDLALPDRPVTCPVCLRRLKINARKDA